MRNAAVITETRNVPLLRVIEHHMMMLPPEFELVFFHNHIGIPHKLQGQLENKFKVTFIPVRVRTLNDYNNLMTSLRFWSELLKYDRVLIFQKDSEILRTGIEYFYDWDYVGAPWKFQEHGGNGGLSLRNPKAMMSTIMRHPYNPILGYEDVYFSNNLVGNLAPRNVCEIFSCETIFKTGTFGAHGIENYHSKKDCEIIRSYIATDQHGFQKLEEKKGYGFRDIA